MQKGGALRRRRLLVTPASSGACSGGGGAWCGGPLDGQGDKAVVVGHVALEDLGAGPQHALEAGPVQLDALEVTPRHHRGRPGPVQQQGDLAEVVGWPEPAHFLLGLAFGTSLQHGCGPLLDDEEVVSGHPLFHDDVAVVERDGLERVRHCQPLPLVQAL
uniref:Putative secreted protein n=1 Tax=Ixodes ricinus TaxID=34613 RepID=A0A6B0UXH7_IXORI